MKKRFVRALVLLISIYIVTLGSGFGFLRGSVQSRWLVGEWIGTMMWPNGTTVSPTSLKVDFIDSHRLNLYISEFPDDESELLWGIPFTYNYISSNELLLTSRGGSRWEVTGDTNQLSLRITDGPLLNQSIELSRIPRINRLIVFLMLILVIETKIFCSSKIHLHQENKLADTALDKNQRSVSKIVILVLAVLISIAGFLSNLKVFPMVSRLGYFFFFGMPWGAWFIIELYTCVLIIASMLITQNSFLRGSSVLRLSKFYLGLFLLASSACGILIGLFLWVGFFIRSCGYTGTCFIY